MTGWLQCACVSSVGGKPRGFVMDGSHFQEANEMIDSLTNDPWNFELFHNPSHPFIGRFRLGIPDTIKYHSKLFTIRLA